MMGISVGLLILHRRSVTWLNGTGTPRWHPWPRKDRKALELKIRMKPYKRIDRFIEAAIYRFAEWISEDKWLGKERDCVNIFASRFILPCVSESSAITEYSQVRIECGVPQPVGFDRPSAAKDLVIWRGAFDVAWDAEWKPTGIPWVVQVHCAKFQVGTMKVNHRVAKRAEV